MRISRVVRRAAALIVLAIAVMAFTAYWTSDNDCDDPNRPPLRHPMQAFVYCDYGTADVLRIEQVETPAPADDELLVRVRAAAVNPLDWHYIRGTPYVMRVDAGLRKPKETRLGVDFAGVVEAVGAGVKRFKPGDEVFGGRLGAFAEYVRIRETGAVTRKPANVTFEQAAGVPVAGVTALQGVRDKAGVRGGTKLLINGASGGVGTFAVQIARALGADVTGVCSTRNVELVRSLGADRVIDYTREDFAQGEARYDAILDNVGNRSLSEFRRVLTPTGRYVLVGGGGPNDHRWFGPVGRLAGAFVMSQFVDQHLGMFLAHLNSADLSALARLMETGAVTPVLDRRYPFSELPAAIRYLEEGHARGKVVITMDDGVTTAATR